MLITLPEGVAAIFLTVVCSFAAVFLIRRAGDENGENGFLVNIFLMGLILRLLFGTIVHVFELREFFGSDALAYDFLGNRAVEVWRGEVASNDWVSQWATRTDGAGWGMNYLTAFIYFIFGRNFLAAQSFCAVIGAATAPMVYVCAHKIFHNHRVSKISAILVAFSPSFIIWSAQLLKDGLVIFLLVLAITMILKLQEKLNYSAVILLVLSMFGIIALRFYIFYMVAIAVVGSFVIGTSSSVKSIVRGFVALVIVGVALTYMGVLRSAGTEFERFGNLERLQISRGELSTAESGYGEDVDVSTAEGALAALPIGFMYLMFAPFPWQITNFRQAITLPEMMIWWSLMPLLLTGLWYTIKNRLRHSISILIFTVLLTLAYSVFQGNVGTAYRQRAQIQVFLFIFIAVGWTLWQERKENRMMMRKPVI
jgi:4-amino-4-deoxy-L-arabinose transferase-like glycosyltransferase